jgi:hypothetical protein
MADLEDGLHRLVPLGGIGTLEKHGDENQGAGNGQPTGFRHAI